MLRKPSGGTRFIGARGFLTFKFSPYQPDAMQSRIVLHGVDDGGVAMTSALVENGSILDSFPALFQTTTE